MSIYHQQEAERIRLEEEEQLRLQKRQKPLSPEQSRQRQIEEAIHRSNLQFIERRAAEAAARGEAPPFIDPHPEPLTPCSVFSRPVVDNECDCSECISGRPKRCLEKTASTSRSP